MLQNFFLKLEMPQLIPFYFVNEVTFTFAVIAISVYMLSKYILPRFVRLFISFISRDFIKTMGKIPSLLKLLYSRLLLISLKDLIILIGLFLQ